MLSLPGCGSGTFSLSGLFVVTEDQTANEGGSWDCAPFTPPDWPPFRGLPCYPSLLTRWDFTFCFTEPPYCFGLSFLSPFLNDLSLCLWPSIYISPFLSLSSLFL